MTLDRHREVHGTLPQLSPHELIELVERSGLRGRGGADFPAARKLRAVAEGRRGATMVVNGSETEPASSKDRLLLERMPHLVLDGAELAAAAVGAREVIVKVGETARGAQRSLQAAIGVRERSQVSFRLVAGDEGYVSGRGERGDEFPQPGQEPADVRPAPAIRARLPRPADAHPESGDAGPDRARRPLRRLLVPGARNRRRPRLGAGHDLGRGRRRPGSTSWPSVPR